MGLVGVSGPAFAWHSPSCGVGVVPQPGWVVLVTVGVVGMRWRGGRPWVCQVVRICSGVAGWWV